MTAHRKAPKAAAVPVLTPEEELRQLTAALTEAEQADSLEQRLRAIAGGVQRLGFSAAAIVILSPAGVPEFVVTDPGAPPNTEDIAPKARLVAMDETLDDTLPALAFPLATGAGSTLARLVVVQPPGGYPRGGARSLRLLGAHAARAIADARLVETADRRAARLQRLQEVGVLLSRSLDEKHIVRELARHVQRVLPSRGVIIAQPDVEAATLDFPLHIEGGTVRPRGAESLAPGVFADVARTGRPVRIASVGQDAAQLAAVSGVVGGDPSGVGSVLAVPMLILHRLVGVVVVYGGQRASFNAEDEELLGTLAAQAAAAIVNARLYEASERERRQSEALAEISRAVSGSLRVSEVLQLIQRHAVALLRAHGAMVAIRRDRFLHVVAATGSGQVLAGMFLPLEGSVAGRAVMTAQAVLTNDLQSEPGVYAPVRELAAIRRSVITPLITEDGPVGVLAVLDRDEAFTSEDVRALQRCADQVAIALVNARLYEAASDATRELAVTFDAIAGGLVVVDDDGHIRRCNTRAAELLGAHGAAEVEGRLFATELLGVHDESEAWPVTRALAERVVQRGTVRNAARGAMYDLIASPHPGGGLVVSFDDVTAFHRLTDRFGEVVEGARDAFYTLNGAGVIATVNAATAALTGVETDQLRGRRLDSLVDAPDREPVRRHIAAVLAGEARRFECDVARPDGTRRRVAVIITPIAHGEAIVGVLGILRDVSPVP